MESNNKSPDFVFEVDESILDSKRNFYRVVLRHGFFSKRKVQSNYLLLPYDYNVRKCLPYSCF